MMPGYSNSVNTTVYEKGKVGDLYRNKQHLRNHLKRMITAMICVEVERGIMKEIDLHGQSQYVSHNGKKAESMNNFVSPLL